MNDLVSLPFAEMTTEQFVFLGGLIILVGILLSRSRRYFARKARQSVAAPTTTSLPHAGNRHEKPSEMQRWEVEMHEMARELSAHLDSKMVALEHLIRDADAATARLQAALVETEPHRAAEPPNANPARRNAVETAHPPDAFHAAYTPAVVAADDPRYRSIYALADQGLSRDVIARRVGTPAGEVDLILSLRRSAPGGK